jgi:hypothetical protein
VTCKLMYITGCMSVRYKANKAERKNTGNGSITNIRATTVAVEMQQCEVTFYFIRRPCLLGYL